MTNPLVQKVEEELARLEFHGAELIHESYSAESFGNAQAIYKIRNLYLNFIRDRGDDTVDFLINPTDSRNRFTFDDMSLVMGWESLDKMMEEVEKARDFSKPPPGPIPLSDALGLIKKHFDQLQDMFSPSKVDTTIEQLKEASRKRCQAFFGWEPKL